MDKIANSKELQAELSQLLAYAQSPRPSRVMIARALHSLSIRVGGEIPEAFKENIQKMKDKAKDKKDDGDDKEDKDQE